MGVSRVEDLQGSGSTGRKSAGVRGVFRGDSGTGTAWGWDGGTFALSCMGEVSRRSGMRHTSSCHM